MTRIDILIRYLIDEDPQYSEMQIPEDLQGKRDLFRALRNVRWPKPVSEEFLHLQNEELQAQLQEKGIVDLTKLSTLNSPLSTTLNSKPSTLNHILWQGDITRLKVDAIVNAANAQMLVCFHPLHKCIDNVIHTVGPIIPNGIPTESQKEQLASCYRSIMACADENGLESVAFCCISTGEFRFPNQQAAEIAVRTVKDYLTVHPDCSVRQVVFNVFKEVDRDIYQRLLLS